MQQRLLFAAVVAAAMILAQGCSARATSSPSAARAADRPAASAPASTVPSSGAQFLGTFYPSQGHTHLTPGEPDDFVYSSEPPTSGPHREEFSSAFISGTPLPRYVQVHLLEHGNILLQYNCKCPSIARALANIALGYDNKFIAANESQPAPSEVQAAEEQGYAVIVAPYPRMKERIAVTAWTRVGSLATVDRARITSFINAYLHNIANATQ